MAGFLTSPGRPPSAENFANRATADPVNKCFLPGVPRIAYMPFPFQIFQTPEFVAITYEYVHASRTVHMKNPKHPDDIAFWMGDSRGHWEGDTLVVDVADNEPSTWLDASGDFHSDALHVIERYTRTSPDTLRYEATIEIRRSTRSRGRSACRSIATRRRMRSFTSTSVTFTRKTAQAC